MTWQLSNTLLELAIDRRESVPRTSRSRPVRNGRGGQGADLPPVAPGVSVEVLAQQYGRSSAAIVRADQRGPGGAHPRAEARVHVRPELRRARPPPRRSSARCRPRRSARQRRGRRPPAGLPPYLASLYGDAPLLTREQEAHLFRKMNYLKYRAGKLRERLDPARAKAARPRRDRAAPGRGAGGQEPDHPRQPPAGRLDRQEAGRRRRTTSSSWSATAT